MAWFYRRVPPAHVPPPVVLEDDEPEESDEQQMTIRYHITGTPDEDGRSRTDGFDEDARPIRFRRTDRDQEYPM